MKSLLFSCLLLAYGWALPGGVVADDDEEKNSSKQALQSLNDLIGAWKGSGAPSKPRPSSQETWRESMSWSWKFKGDDAWLVVAIKNGKYFKSGELRYLLDKKQYQLTLLTKAGAKQVYAGDLKDEILTLDRLDPDSQDTQRIKFNSAAEGIRLIYRVEHKPAGRSIFLQDYRVECTKEGESLVAKQKKIECVVSGGLGTMPVSYKGVTYYVCCSGCRDAFMENPEKYIKEYEAKQAGKK
jgi:hypothetical protein